MDGGELWPEIGDWERVTDAVVALTRGRGCGAIPLGVPPVMAASLANGPKTSLVVHGPDGATELGERDRAGYLDEVTAAVADTVTSSGRLWPGDGLIEPPRDPQHLPYHPARERP